MNNELLNDMKEIKQSVTTFHDKMNVKLKNVQIQNTNKHPQTATSSSKKPEDDNKQNTRLKFIGLAESAEEYKLNQKLNDKKAVNRILADFGLKAKSSDCIRLGKFVLHERRPILVTFNSIWYARTCLSKAIQNKPFETNQLPIVRALSCEEQEIEKAVRKKRFWLVQSGADKSQLETSNLKLYNNGELVSLV